MLSLLVTWMYPQRWQQLLESDERIGSYWYDYMYEDQTIYLRLVGVEVTLGWSC
jgi:hypothetical protein